MAIRFVDVEPGKGEGSEPAPHRRARVPDAAPRPEPAAGELPAVTGRAAGGTEDAEGAGEAPLPPPLPHAKPEPKPRGRKKPMAPAGAPKGAGEPGAPAAPAALDAPSAPLLQGLLPELQAHAKPTPKPRGRKKAFG